MSTKPETIQIDSRFGVKTHSNLFKQETGSDKLLIILPGLGYTGEFPVLYYLRKAAGQLGYDVLTVEYGFQAAHTGFSFEQIPELADDVQDTVDPVLARNYKQVCIAGKSLGSPLAANLARSIKDAAVSLILLTPIKDTAHDLDGFRTLAIIGTTDPNYSAQTVADFEGHSDVKWRVFEGLNHSLEVTENWRESAKVLADVIQTCADFLGD